MWVGKLPTMRCALTQVYRLACTEVIWILRTERAGYGQAEFGVHPEPLVPTNLRRCAVLNSITS